MLDMFEFLKALPELYKLRNLCLDITYALESVEGNCHWKVSLSFKISVTGILLPDELLCN